MAITLNRDLLVSSDRPKVTRARTVTRFKHKLHSKQYDRHTTSSRLVYDPSVKNDSYAVTLSCEANAINAESYRLALVNLNYGYLYQDDSLDVLLGRNDLVSYSWDMSATTIRHKRNASSLRAYDFLIECMWCKSHLPYHLSHNHIAWIWSGSFGSALKRAIAMYKAFALPRKSACVYSRKPELLAKRIADYGSVYSGYID